MQIKRREPANTKRNIPIDEIATDLGIECGAVYKLLRGGTIPAVRVLGWGRLTVNRLAYEKWRKNGTVETKLAPPKGE